MSGRPLRFFGATIVGWVAVRAVMLWPTVGPAAIPRALVPAAFADDARDTAPRVAGPLVSPAQFRSVFEPVEQPLQRLAPVNIASVSDRGTVEAVRSPTAAAPSPKLAAPQTLLGPPPAIPPVARAPLDRWSASAWFVLRDGRGIAPGLGGGQLGGGQAGLRIAYAIGNARRVAIVGRVATPLKGSGREAAIGLEWRPTRLPVRLVAEYRVALDGGGSGPAAGIIAGTGPAPLAAGFDLETYAQAGIVRRRRDEPFADGAARLSRSFATVGGAKLDLGIGGWGGAQRGAQRLDFGPSLGVRIPIAGKAIRLSLDWRQRIAGKARPGSGPVLVIGSDF